VKFDLRLSFGGLHCACCIRAIAAGRRSALDNNTDHADHVTDSAQYTMKKMKDSVINYITLLNIFLYNNNNKNNKK